MFHSPVLLEESVKFLIQNINGTYIDCTFGRGGHSNLILDTSFEYCFYKLFFDFSLSNFIYYGLFNSR